MEHILNENELNEAYEQLSAVHDKITDLKKRQAEINQMITASAIAKVKARYPGIEFGDKVEVVCNASYDWKNPKATKTMVGFIGNFFLSRFFFEHDHDRENYVRLELYQVKKDGTRSLKKDEISSMNIVSIKKVEE
jgi:hypothetical protein